MRRVWMNFLAVIMVSATLVSCTSDDYYVRPIKKQKSDKTYEIDLNPQMEEISSVEASISDSAKEALGLFNLKLLNELNQRDKNLFFSSMSINSALTMAYFGAKGDTQSEMHDVLCYDDLTIKDIASAQRSLINSYKETGDTTFDIANSVWIDDQCYARDTYTETMGSVFSTSVNNIDLQGNKSVDVVNGWVSHKTNGMIPELLIKEQDPLKYTMLLLLNAIYFNGSWSEPFNANETVNKQFHGATVKNIASMMSSEKDVLGYDGKGYSSIALPYGKDKRFYMIVVLPDEDIEEFIISQTPESWYSILSTFKLQYNAIYQLPKFEMDETVDLNDTLKALGMSKAFDGSADFSYMAFDDISISTIFHKAKIKVDELGTEAAAVTEVGVDGCALEIPKYDFEFYADKPFLFFVVDSKEQIVVFTGKVCDIS